MPDDPDMTIGTGSGNDNEQSAASRPKTDEHREHPPSTSNVDVPAAKGSFGTGTPVVTTGSEKTDGTSTSSTSPNPSGMNSLIGGFNLQITGAERPRPRVPLPNIQVTEPIPFEGMSDSPKEPDIQDATATIGFSDRVEVEVIRGETGPVKDDSKDKTPQGSHGTGIDARRRGGEESKALDVDIYAEVLARFFKGTPPNDKDTPPNDGLSFGLFAPWGRGKTYLFEQVEKKLKEISPEYRIVKFSAWKYRSTPEIWAYLYETFYSSASKESRFISVRMNLIRNGLWPLIFLSLGLLIGTTPKLKSFEILSRSIGLFSAIHLVFLSLRAKPFFEKVRLMYLADIRHSGALGLQYSIGENLKLLLTAWSPGAHTSASWIQLFTQAISEFCKGIGNRNFTQWASGAKWIVLPIVALLLIIQIWSTGVGSFSDSISSNPGVWLIELLSVAIPLILVGFPLYIETNPLPQKRILLVIDDLDRCLPEQMVEIVECLQQFLDEDELKNRLQMCFLIDDEAFAIAIKHRYRRLIRNESGDNEMTETRVVHESFEKLFLVTLRLPELNRAESREIMEKATKEMLPLEKSRSTDTQMPTKKSTEGSVSKLSKAESDELVASTERIHKLFKEDPVSPRTLRSLILRYQLARTLIGEIGDEEIDPQKILTAILEPADDDSNSDTNRVGRQVAFFDRKSSA